MRPMRKVISVEVNNEVFGFFANFKTAYRVLVSEKFELKGYHNEIKKFRRMESLKLLAVKRGQRFFTVNIRKMQVNHTIMTMQPIFDY